MNELISSFEIWVTNEERDLLRKLKNPIKVAQLEEHEQFRVQTLIRKSLVTKYGFEDPTVVANEEYKEKK